MTYPALVEVVEGGCIATLLGNSDCRAVGATREQALDRLSQLLTRKIALQLAEPQEIVRLQIELPNPEHPSLQQTGKLKDNPLFEQVMVDIETARQKEREEELRQLDAEMESPEEEVA